MPATTVDIVPAPVKSSWASKINWTNAAGAAATLSALIGVLPIPEDRKAAIVGLIALVTQGATIVQRTWFTKSVTAASVG